MTNREKLLNANIYDLLVEMNAKMTDNMITSMCVLDLFVEDFFPCPKCKTTNDFSCNECIQKFLNKEV